MHKRGIVHRDLKPENVMVGDNDRIKLIDFGIAMKEDARRLTFVNVSSMLGTPDYIAPEQVQGKRGDQRSDMYALGIMFYEMLTGQVPFSGPNPLAVMNDRLVRDPIPPRELNPDNSAAIGRDRLSGRWKGIRAIAMATPTRWSGTSKIRSRSGWKIAASAPPGARASLARQTQQADLALRRTGAGAGRAVRSDAGAGKTLRAAAVQLGC